MAPKRMPKVTSLSASASNGSSASSSRSRSSNPFGPVDPSTYHDFDESMQDGVELEEKGERFQFGPKAQRFYVQAGTLYTRAAQLAGANVERRADAVYNASRIHFLLASQFALPPENMQSFVEAVESAQQAVQLAAPVSNAGSAEVGLPNPFALDAMTHLATCLQTLAEVVEELGWPSGLHAPSLSTQGTRSAPSPSLLWSEALKVFQQVADGQYTILQDQRTDAAASDEEAPSAATPSTGIEEDEEDLRESTGEDAVYGYTSSLVTPASLMETFLSMMACYTSLIDASATLDGVQMLNSAAQQIYSKAEALASEFQLTGALPATTNDAAQASSEEAAIWGEMQRSSLTLRVAVVCKAIVLASDVAHISAEVEALMQTVNDWAARLIATPTSAEIVSGRRDAKVAELCDVGEAGQNICRASLRLKPTGGGAAAVWSLATSSTKLFSQALAALDTSAAGGGSAAVLGQANTSTPTSRARCRILLALASMSIFRSHPAFEAAGIAGARGTRTKLLDNARLYARKAVTEIGLGWLLRIAPAQAPKSVIIPPSGGWESLSLESEATLHLLRALLVRNNVLGAADRKAVNESQVELDSLVLHIRHLRKRPVQVGSSNDAASIELAHWLYTQSVKSFVDDIVDDNGRDIVESEIACWDTLLSDHSPC
ncbi:hypothetical protein PHSY_001484 [Pseudozyma hubeiensis SY62]|uniref:Uncharacterized protein n=1 Tax=Pseudozyma hubeiensis (strain SY62) TaxID=1305764 RepID=R9NYY1_PSEHS|nr:hypothetical protein PHSY_001484 [Pseudozyma hubeiensis SY62]GAC93916.1 hypothetical protein PHSY_001484 [Pseudozyma hubeiensis SY62]